MTYLIIAIKNNFNGEINLGVTFPDHHTYIFCMLKIKFELL